MYGYHIYNESLVLWENMNPRDSDQEMWESTYKVDGGWHDHENSWSSLHGLCRKGAESCWTVQPSTQSRVWCWCLTLMQKVSKLTWHITHWSGQATELFFLFTWLVLEATVLILLIHWQEKSHLWPDWQRCPLILAALCVGVNIFWLRIYQFFFSYSKFVLTWNTITLLNYYYISYHYQY